MYVTCIGNQGNDVPPKFKSTNDTKFLEDILEIHYILFTHIFTIHSRWPTVSTISLAALKLTFKTYYYKKHSTKLNNKHLIHTILWWRNFLEFYHLKSYSLLIIIV